ncbi:DUF397 domain-containing protein [Amycolatopsis sp. NPDC049691]|uniref:DUF397 domain-containing protein n=1 Tax=Amycolatopsis sp. NPDC049691 TaxID=3155155 RepID=UPI00344446AD
MRRDSSGGRAVNRWRKSTYSAIEGNCVEVRLDRSVGIRDTKARGQGQLTVTPAAWSAVLSSLRG